MTETLEQPVDEGPGYAYTEPDLCNLGWPYALAKAATDNGFEYALGLRTGQILVFTGAEPVEPLTTGFVRLTGVSSHWPAPDNDLHPGDDMRFDRGIEIRISEIAWVADAPWGS